MHTERWFLWICGLAFVPAGMAGTVRAGEPGPETAPPKLDVYGDPLPKGVLARLGTVRFRLAGDITGLQFSPDGKRLLASSNRPIQLLDSESGARLLATEGSNSDHGAPKGTAAFSPNGQWVAIADDNHDVVLADAASGKTLRVLKGHTSDVEVLAISPDGAWLAGGDDDGTLVLWDVARGAQVARVDMEDMNWSALAFSPDGKQLVAGGNSGRILRFELVPRESDGVRFLAAQGGSVTGLAWSADGSRLAFLQEMTLRVCDPVSGRELCSFEGQKDLQAVALAPDGKTAVAATGNNKLLFVDVEAGKLLAEKKLEDSCERLAFSPDGKWLAIFGTREAVELWDAAQRKVARKFERPATSPSTLSFTSDSKRLQAGTTEGFYTWDVKDGALTRSLKPGARLRGAVPRAPGDRL